MSQILEGTTRTLSAALPGDAPPPHASHPRSAAPAAEPDRTHPAFTERLDLRAAYLASLAAWAAFGMLETLKAYFFRVVDGTPRPFAYSLLEQMPWSIGWMLMMPAVLWLARTYRFDGPRWRRSAVVHVVCGKAMIMAHLAAITAVYHYSIATGAATSLAARFGVFFVRFVFTEYVTYAAVLGIYYAFEYWAGYRRSALAAAQAEARAARLQLSLAESRIHALRMELNPHFLFNSLNAVAGLIRRREPNLAVEMLARLGDLLRATLDREMPAEVTLAEELELLRRYLEIEQVRFGDRLRVAWEIDAATERALVPPLILQPLVENAVRHGISRRPGAAVLRVSTRRLGDTLELAVRDTGDGLKLVDGRGVREGIGLSNVRARLAELYGPERTTLDLGEAPGGGVRACVALPFHVGARDGDFAFGA